LHAVGLDLPLASGLLILFTMNLAIIVPSTPAQLGALELGALAGLDLLQVGHEPALAFALLYHAVMILPLLATGLVLELRLVTGRAPDGVTAG
ncbi:MAG: lysylphosphatidylglycerol synthase domain-containing protein, partial [Kofleriaceae bacterium]